MKLRIGLAAAISAAVLLAAPVAASADSGVPAGTSHAPHHHFRCAEGHRRVRVPDVEGLVVGRARARLRHHRLHARFATPAEGIVAYQVPAPGKRAACGSAVTLHMAATG